MHLNVFWTIGQGSDVPFQSLGPQAFLEALPTPPKHVDSPAAERLSSSTDIFFELSSRCIKSSRQGCDLALKSYESSVSLTSSDLWSDRRICSNSRVCCDSSLCSSTIINNPAVINAKLWNLDDMPLVLPFFECAELIAELTCLVSFGEGFLQSILRQPKTIDTSQF